VETAGKQSKKEKIKMLTRIVEVHIEIEEGTPIGDVMKALDKEWVKNFAIHTKELKTRRGSNYGVLTEAVLAALPGTTAEVRSRVTVPGNVAGCLKRLRDKTKQVKYVKRVWSLK